MNLARAAYHEQSLGHGLDDYYSEWGERPGLWWGGGAELLGLEGYAAPGSIVSLIEGRDPASGELLRRPTSSALVTRRVFDPESGGVVERQVEQKRVGGWDFAFSAPKSISLALTFGDTDTRRELLAAHRAAVEAALILLESEAVRVRVGAQGAFRHETHGLLAVVIEHAWARAVSADATPDPQLHTHVVVANMAKSREDECEWWRTLDMQPVLREWKRAASATYQAVLRHEVSSRLGWEWAEPRNNLAELKQWPVSVLRAFSRRREQIEAFLAGGEPTWARAQAAAIQTRQAKGAPRDEAADRAAARARLGEHVDARQLEALLAPGRHGPAPLDARRLGGVFQRLVGEHGLTERESSFSRGDVVRELAFALGSAPDTDSLLVAAGAFLALEEVVQLDERRFTTRGLQAAEQRITRLAERPAPRALVLATGPGGDRHRAYRERARLRAQRRATRPRARRDRRPGFGVARARRRRIRQDDHARRHRPGLRARRHPRRRSRTHRRRRTRHERSRHPRAHRRARAPRPRARDYAPASAPRPASCSSTRPARSGRAPSPASHEAVAHADAKLVLVGDDAQLPAVAAGTTYANLLDASQPGALAPDPATLRHADRRARPRRGTRARQPAHRHVRRRRRIPRPQARRPARSDTLDRATALRPPPTGTPHTCRTEPTPTRIALIARSQAPTRRAQRAGPRRRCATAGRLGPDIHGLAPAPLAVGDVVVCRRNDRRLAVTNGARGRITQITATRSRSP